MDNVEMNRWDSLDVSGDSRERIWAKSRSFGQDVWFRFSRKPAALISLGVLAIITLFSFVGPFFSQYGYSEQNLDYTSTPPIMSLTILPGFENGFYVTQSMKVIEVTRDGILKRSLSIARDNSQIRQTTFSYDDGVDITLDYTERPPQLIDQSGTRISPSHNVWNARYFLGSDHLGRDILTRLMFGCRISLIVAVVAAAVNMIIGTLYGGIAGYLGGVSDSVMMRIVDIISTIPLTLYVILIKVTLENTGLVSIIIALSSVYWVNMARVVRGEVLRLKNQEFVTAALTIGTSTRDILVRHLVPNAMGPIIVTATMLIPSAIFMEAFMSYIGIGIAPPMASLGTMCNDATETLRTTPYQLLMPAILICVLMFAFSFLGDGLRDALDPKLKK